ncbi:hypothetical protein DESHY_20079 [Desulforamulus hydrothermalis Lam5 = DSM 18033]|uniref:Uncharacterized protein n=1 Tax=Desulforamulus hydrothermalis Lam5 = DSM 18033 TaxID=1121428 RepID=K8DZ69_9FIRM|nr:hypothetical protein DESHY_20079 [Desulforamulus hydrothermalis Lam5 = DSM 18033]SHH22376.1 hypothetical protein SAMN02745177_01870 [Desulforamulus hydrothermalis Lam5 = DSM 18033]
MGKCRRGVLILKVVAGCNTTFHLDKRKNPTRYRVIQKNKAGAIYNYYKRRAGYISTTALLT